MKKQLFKNIFEHLVRKVRLWYLNQNPSLPSASSQHHGSNSPLGLLSRTQAPPPRSSTQAPPPRPRTQGPSLRSAAPSRAFFLGGAGCQCFPSSPSCLLLRLRLRLGELVERWGTPLGELRLHPDCRGLSFPAAWSACPGS